MSRSDRFARWPLVALLLLTALTCIFLTSRVAGANTSPSIQIIQQLVASPSPFEHLVDFDRPSDLKRPSEFNRPADVASPSSSKWEPRATLLPEQGSVGPQDDTHAISGAILSPTLDFAPTLLNTATTSRTRLDHVVPPPCRRAGGCRSPPAV